MQPTDHTDLLDLSFDRVTMRSAVAPCVAWCQAPREPHTVLTANAAILCIGSLASEFSQHRFIYPVHLNPNVKGPVSQLLEGKSNVFLIPPQDYRSHFAL